jgi:glycosyltransferase involved in cell wall biosynthesis
VNSLLQQANSTSARLIPHNDLFESCNFVAAMKAARNAIPDWRHFSAKRNDLYKRNFAAELMKSESMRSHVIEASLLDPEVEPMRIESASSYCSVPWSNRHWGFDLETLYTMIGTPGFTDVVLLPWLKPGGAEKYILQILGELKCQGAADKILVISGESASAHEWVSRLPPGSVFIDLYNSFPHLDRQDLSALTVRALLAVAKPQARLHLKSSRFSHEVMERFGAAIAGHMQPIYYRFSNGAFLWNEARLESPSEIRYLRKQLGHIKMLVSDCESIRDKDSGVIGITKLKHQVIYASCELSSVATPVLRTPKFRLLWASRICREKRPDLLTSIAKAVQNKFPSINIDVYGNFEHPYTDDIIKCEGLNYRGSYSGFGELPIDRYDGLLYTTAFDGLPNAILEALGAGLPVIAPAIGGIPEAVIDGETGILLDDHISEDVMAERYVQAIERVYADWSTWMTMSDKARSLIAARHSPTAHAESVKRAFAIKCAELQQ